MIWYYMVYSDWWKDGSLKGKNWKHFILEQKFVTDLDRIEFKGKMNFMKFT